MKRSTAIAVVLAALVIIVAIAVLAAVLWGLTGIRVVALCYLPIGAAFFLWAYKLRRWWEDKLLALAFLVFAASHVMMWLADGSIVVQIASLVLLYSSAACIWVCAIAYWRRFLHKRRHPSTHPPTTQGA